MNLKLILLIYCLSKLWNSQNLIFYFSLKISFFQILFLVNHSCLIKAFYYLNSWTFFHTDFFCHLAYNLLELLDDQLLNWISNLKIGYGYRKEICFSVILNYTDNVGIFRKENCWKTFPWVYPEFQKIGIHWGSFFFISHLV